MHDDRSGRLRRSLPAGSRVPWRTDRELTPPRAAHLVEERFPEFAPAHAERFGEGWDSEALLVNSDWVFLFPKRQEVVEPFRRGLGLTRLVAEVSPVPVPDFRFVGEPGPEFPYPFAGYRRLPGVPAGGIRPERRHWPALAAALGEMLGAVHSLDPAPFGEHEPPGEIPRLPDSLARAVRESLGEDVDPSLEALLRGEFGPLSPCPLPAVPIHDDLLADHVLIDAEGRRITGVIDWMDMCLGDPAADLVGLFLWLGETFVKQVLDRYSRPIDPGVLDRVRHRARICALGEYGWTLHPASFADPAPARARLLRALRPETRDRRG